MANTVNVTTANTFDEWRIKTNEIGTGVGDLDALTVANTGATGVVTSLAALLDAIESNDTDIATNVTNIATNVTNIATNTAAIAAIDTSGITTNATNIGTIGSLATAATNLTAAVNELHGEINTNTTNIAAIAHGIDDVIVDGTSGTGQTIYIDTDVPGGGDGANGDMWFEY
jgi:hypothetical protein